MTVLPPPQQTHQSDQKLKYAVKALIYNPSNRTRLLKSLLGHLNLIIYFQVEYAMEAIGHAGTCMGMLADDGIILAAERRNTNKLLDEAFHSEKIYHLNENMACSVAGITSDANVLVKFYNAN